MKPDKYTERKKELWMLKSKVDYYSNAIKNQSKIPLDKPYQRGWKLSWEFRIDIQRREDYPYILAIHNLLHRSVWSKYQDPRNEYKIWKIDLRGDLPYYRSLNQHEFDELLPWAQKWITPSFNKRLVKEYIHVFPDYWLQLKAVPHIIDYQYEHNEILYQQRDYFSDKLNAHPLYKYSYRWHGERVMNKFSKASQKLIVKKMVKTQDWDLQDNLSYFKEQKWD